MVELPISAEMVEFATNVARATYSDRLDWETTADEDVLVAPLGGPYTARLQRVFRRDESSGEEYDSIELVLLKAREELFTLSGDILSDTVFARVRPGNNAWAVLRELWNRSLLKAKKVTEELDAVNKLLGAKLKGVAADDDEEVPF